MSFTKVHIENPITNDYGDLDLLFYASDISKPNLDLISTRKEQADSEMAVDNGGGSTTNENQKLTPGEIILYRKSSTSETTVVVPDETPDEGEIDDDIQVVKDNDKNMGNGVAQFADEKFVEINRDKGDITFLSVTNTGSQRIRVCYLF